MEQFSTPHKVVCFGEVLWDILPSAELPGGAPMNVAYHLKKLGIDPALITKTGRDDYGKRLIEILLKSGVSTDYFTVDSNYPTGLVYANPNEHHEVVYDIVYPSAWDFIEWNDKFKDLVSHADFFVFGSLASRSKVSRETLSQLLEIAKTKVLDINLRPPHFNRVHIESLLHKADVLKMNLAELELVTGWSGHFNNTDDRIKKIQEQFNIEKIIVTMGGDGAIINDNGILYKHAGYKVNVADTIGSGDAFLAGYISQVLKGATVSDTLAFSCAMGAFVATLNGACPQYEISEITRLMLSDSTQKTDKNL